MEHWYVYYKLPAVDLDAVLPSIRALLAAVEHGSGARVRLQTRVDVPDGIATVMEIYEGIADPAAFGPRLAHAVESSSLPTAVRSGRRTERFRTL